MLKWLWVSALVIVLDQLTKLWASSALEYAEPVAVVVSAVLLVWLKRLQAGQVWLPLALTLVLGGALGNVIDRVYYGYVVDFIDVYYQHWHWPAFNLADSAIFVGALMLIIDSLRPEKKS
jgi:signal peptidase II